MVSKFIYPNSYRNNVLSILLNLNAENSEPFPTFDIEINKEDKDADVENQEIKKDPKIDNHEDEETVIPDQG
jgi:hypothetical protein